MNTTDLVHFFSADAPPRHSTTSRPALAPSRFELAAPVRSAIVRSRHDLIGRQRLDGSWAGRRTWDASSLHQLLLMDAYLRREPSEFSEQAVRTIQRDQRPDGGWSLTSGRPLDLNQSVLSYFALKLCGENANQPEMTAARHAILERGGADACSASTRLWLALLGQIGYEHCAPIAPEGLLTAACTGNLTAADELRLAALSVVWALRPRRELDIARGIRELFIEPPQNWPKHNGYFPQQSATALTGFWSGCERIGFVPLRQRALDRANFLLTEAAIEAAGNETTFEVFAWQRIAVEALGHAPSGRVIAACERRHQLLTGTEPDEARSQPETRLTADTSVAVEALAASGVGIEELPVALGIRWLLTHRLRPARESTSANELAAMLNVCTCLPEASEMIDSVLPPILQLADHTDDAASDHEHRLAPIPLEQFRDTLQHDCRALQRSDGGWILSSSTNECHRWHGLLRANVRCSGEVSEPDSTGAMLELLSRELRASNKTAIDRGIAFLRHCQRGDGSWQSAGGTQRIHATASAVRGLAAVGVQPTDSTVAAGINWLLVEQHVSGGWGEAKDPTSIETAMAVLAFLAAGRADHEATRRGIRFLIDRQRDDGAWVDRSLTQCDVASGPRYHNDLMSSAATLLALARWAVAISKQNHADEPSGLRLVCNDVPW